MLKFKRYTVNSHGTALNATGDIIMRDDLIEFLKRLEDNKDVRVILAKISLALEVLKNDHEG